MTGTTATGPAVSVVVTCYDLGRYLGEALDSVLAQTVSDVEILVVDDGSTAPETVSLLASLARPRTRVVRIDNRGLSGARNVGIAETTGRYLCFLDADDVLEPTCLERSLEVLERDPDVAFVSHWVRSFGGTEEEWRPERCDFPALLDMNTVNGAALVRRAPVLAVGGFDETLRVGCEDWDLWIGLVARGYRGVILPEVLFRYRRRADSMSRLMNQEGWHPELYAALVRKHRESFRQHLRPLFLRRARAIGALSRHTETLRAEDLDWLGPESVRRRERLERLQRRVAAADRLAAAQAEAERVTVERIAAVRAEAEALRASMSWRVTAPLRRVYGWLLRLRRS